MSRGLITQLREELHRLAEELDYDFSRKELIENSVELDNVLNSYNKEVDIKIKKCNYK